MRDPFDQLESTSLAWRDYWRIVVHRRWWVMGPLLTFSLLGVVVARYWPPLYRSEALILVEQQKVPDQYVTPNVVANLQDRLESMTQQILSRTRLQRVVEQFNLYSRERTRLTMDEIIDKMRKHIRLELVEVPGRPGNLSAFRLSFGTESPRVAQQVTNELTSLFIEENLQARAQQSASTTKFLENQLEEARKDLADQEQRLREFKVRFLGELPEQQQSNLEILSSLEAQLHATTDELSRADQQRVYFDSMRVQYHAAQAPVGPGGSGSSGATRRATLQELRQQLAVLEGKYSSRHPDVLRLKDEIARLQSSSEAAAGGQPGSGGGGAAGGPASVSNEPVLIEVESRLNAVTKDVQNRQKEMDQLRKKIAQIQARLNLTPLREQQIAEVTRNYENSRAYYQSLLQKKLQSELATNLEKRQQGEQFRLIDPPSLPEKPVEPDRARFVLGGWLIGLASAVSLAVLREYTDDTLRNEEDVARQTHLPVLVRIPVLMSPGDESRREWRRKVEFAVVTLVGLTSISAGLYTSLMS